MAAHCGADPDLTKALTSSGIELRETNNLVDAIWEDRPEPPRNPVEIHPDEFCG